MSDPRFTEPIPRPAHCPFCRSKVIDTLAKIVTPTSFWRCRQCEKTWTIGGQPASPRAR